MFKAYQALLLLAQATEKQLAAQVQYLKAENQILRGKLPRRFWITPQERQRLVKLGRPLGTAIRERITIVTPRTFARWVNGDAQLKRKRRTPIPTPGRPKTPDDVRVLVVRLARERLEKTYHSRGLIRRLQIASPQRAASSAGNGSAGY